MNEPEQLKARDTRLYFPDLEGWQAEIKGNWDNEYCFTANPGETFFHLLMNGEVYVRRGNEKYCLNCAVRQGFVTFDRGYWQKSGSSFDNEIQPPAAKDSIENLFPEI